MSDSRTNANPFLKIFGWSGKLTRGEYLLYGLLPATIFGFLTLFFMFIDSLIYLLFILFALLFVAIYIPTALKRWRDIGLDTFTTLLFTLLPIVITFVVAMDMVDPDNIIFIYLLIPFNFIYLVSFPSNFLKERYYGILLFIATILVSIFSIDYIS